MYEFVEKSFLRFSVRSSKKVSLHFGLIFAAIIPPETNLFASMKYWRIVLAPSWIIFLFLSISGANISAQQLVLTGTVIDSSTMEAVPFATVALGVDKGTISDETGYFRLPVSQVKFDDTLYVTSIGYMQERIPVFDLTFRAENRIYLNPAVYELSSVVIQGKKRRIPTAKHIIRKAIDSLIVNHAHDTSTYTGYYREYMKEDEQYVNLFESIIEYQEYLKDSLFEFNASLLFERFNRDFRTDGALLAGYDNANKYVPYATVGTAVSYTHLRAHET